MQRTGDVNNKKESQEWRVDPGNLLLIVYTGLVVLLLLLGVVGFSNASGIEQVDQVETAITLDEVKGGELLVPSGDSGKYILCPTLSQDVEITISGMVARTTVKQRFINESDSWIEATYAFPLPEKSGVDTLNMIVGERKIVGQIKEKKEAKKMYEMAKREGKKSSLLVQKRPNLFMTSVANIGPGEVIEIEIQYQEKVSYDDNVFSLRFPMAITPRYQPPGKGQDEENSSALSELSFSGSGWGNTSKISNDADDGNLDELIQQSDIPVTLTVSLQSGFPLNRLDSLYHGVTAQKIGEEHRVKFDGRVIADRDFVLEWEPVASANVEAALFSETGDDGKHLLLMLTPPKLTNSKPEIPRELIFVLDTSGSMGGASIRQAKAGLGLALSRLQPTDTFNVIEFNSDARMLYERAKTANNENIREAQSFVSSLKADGGTEMMQALRLALAEQEEASMRMRQVVFITDGAVGNEQELFKMIHNNLGESRLFTVGIGSAPNSFFMTRAAKTGRGTFTYIGKPDEIKDKMDALLSKIRSPQVHDISIMTGDEDIEMYPTVISDLYKGEPLLVSMKVADSIENITVKGKAGAKPWQVNLDIRGGSKTSGIAKLWAREKIGQQMESLIRGADKDDVRKSVLDVALKYKLVSKYTSLVAIEEKISRPKESE